MLGRVRKHVPPASLTCESCLESPPKRSFLEAGAHDPYCNSFEAGAQNPYCTCSAGPSPLSTGNGAAPAVGAAAPSSSSGSSAEDSSTRRVRQHCRRHAAGAPDKLAKAAGRLPSWHGEEEATASHRRACSRRVDGPALILQRWVQHQPPAASRATSVAVLTNGRGLAPSTTVHQSPLQFVATKQRSYELLLLVEWVLGLLLLPTAKYQFFTKNRRCREMKQCWQSLKIEFRELFCPFSATRVRAEAPAFSTKYASPSAVHKKLNPNNSNTNVFMRDTRYGKKWTLRNDSLSTASKFSLRARQGVGDLGLRAHTEWVGI